MGKNWSWGLELVKRSDIGFSRKVLYLHWFSEGVEDVIIFLSSGLNQVTRDVLVRR